MLIRFPLVSIFCLLVSELIAQYNQTQTFDISYGLALTECNGVYCDHAGRIWTPHANSMISCFDGISFRRFAPEETGHNSASAQFAEDHMGFWIFQSTESISLFKNEKWTHWKVPSFRSIEVDKNSNQLVALDSAGILYHLDPLKMQWESHAKAPHLPKDHEYSLKSSLHENKYLLQIIATGAPWQPVNAFISSSLMNPDWIENPALIYTSLEWNLHDITSDQMVYVTSQFPLLKQKDTYRELFMSGNTTLLTYSTPSENGLNYVITVYYSDSTQQFQAMAIFENPNRNIQMTIDKQGHLWAASQAGLVRINPGILQCFENNNNMVASLHSINEGKKGQIWFGGYESGLCYFDGEKINPAPKETSHYKRILPGSYRDENANMAFWTEDYWMVTYHDGKWSDTKTNGKNHNREVGYFFLPIQDNQVAAGFQSLGLGITKKPLTPTTDWQFISKEKGLLLDNVLTVTEDLNGRLWTGRASQGMAIYDPVHDTARTWLLIPDSLMNFGVCSSTLDAAGRLWMGCSDGIRVIQKPELFKIFKDEITDVVQKISMDEAAYSLVTFINQYHNYIVFGNLTGYGFIDLNDFSLHPAMPKIYFYPTEKFGGSCEQNAVLIDSKDYLWFGQDKGATRIDFLTFHPDTLPIKIIVDSMLAGSEKIELSVDNPELSKITSSKKLPTLKRYIEIFLHSSFTGLLNDNVGFQYRLLHDKVQDTTWSHYAKTNKITFSYMPPGKNRVEIRAIKNNQIADVAILDLYIPLALSESPWFWISSFGGLSIIGAFISFLFYRQQLRMKEYQINLSEQRREKEQFQIRAIASSLNPHFIKNSLNWAQTRFRSDPKVVTVINELSSNISTIFNRSREGQAFHSLKDEFELVKNYISIQQATYGQFLDITLPDLSTIELFKNIFVPLMQIQIHVENAIEHGIRNRTGAHLLYIALEDEKDYVHLTITDDGIGRKGAIELGSHGTQQGTVMLKSLYDIFNQYNDYKFSSTYEDLPLTDPVTGIAVGTRVHIFIPKHFEYQYYENNKILHS
ncbi:MAG TPA: histidine kinase [Saprospiraceae bacterium]|nr:histidine kinase [Saprospiraceae bacterium]